MRLMGLAAVAALILASGGILYAQDAPPPASPYNGDAVEIPFPQPEDYVLPWQTTSAATFEMSGHVFDVEIAESGGEARAHGTYRIEGSPLFELRMEWGPLPVQNAEELKSHVEYIVRVAVRGALGELLAPAEPVEP